MSEREDGALVGTVLQDSYRLIRLIGAGGMGAVYEGVQLRLNKRVAVKLMTRDLAANQEALARFRREAEVTSHLGHPHIVNVFDFGTAPSGASYLVMEYLEGEDLDHRLRRTGRQALNSTIHVVKQVGSALAATHAKGVVHRDLKPANLFVLEVEGETDFVKVVDFGISKVRAATTKLTGASAVMGTPNYMSPEQAMGMIDEIDHRTDQWSLACIAYEMLAGRGPFVGESAASLLYQVIHQEPPPLATKVPGLPAEVEQVLKRAMSKKMADRFPSVIAFSRAFEAAGSGTPIVVETSAQIAKTSEVATVPARERAEKRQPAQPTTFSNTASEVLPAGSQFGARVRQKWVVAAAGGAALLVTVVLVARSRPSPSTALRDIAALPSPAPVVQAAPPPTLQPSVQPPTPPPAQKVDVAPPGAAELTAKTPEPSAPALAATPTVQKPAKGALSESVPKLSSHRSGGAPGPGGAKASSRYPTAESRSATTATPAGGAKRPGWVDPFEQEEAPRQSPPADQGTKRPTKPKRRLIEDL